ncbi:potassium channel family protein [Marinimicrobium koreense]|uniref:potassium channel family protein n=1 Tax=Marinimicrobium koreense TaxID=306545 RepID=UPI003F70F888
MEPQKLWTLTPEEFNIWRQKNDLPKLLSFFKEELPYFEDWMSQWELSDVDFCLAPHTSGWFLGEDELYFHQYTEDGDTKYVICQDFDGQFEFLSKHRNIVRERSVGFTPYLAWGKSKTGKKKFIQSDKLNKGFSETLVYGLWSGGRCSRAHLLKKFPVLKLGQVIIGDGVLVSPRNLDFVDLDELVIKGHHHGSYAAEVNFSSCRNVKIQSGGMHHVSFRESVVDNFECTEGNLQDFLFLNSSLNSFQCSNSSINGLVIKKSIFLRPLIDTTEIQRFSYVPDHTYKRYKAEADTCRRIRNLFQSIGRRHEAQDYYYMERCYERKALWSPYLEYENRSEFPKRKYAGRLSDLISHWKERHCDNKQAIQYIISIFAFKIKLWFLPKYSIKAAKYKLNYLGSLLSYLIWGYGLKVSRVCATALVIILSYTTVYYFQGPTTGNLIDSLYYSTVTFTTLGYGDILPNSENVKLICASEALLGALTMGLIIGVFSKKSEY